MTTGTEYRFEEIYHEAAATQELQQLLTRNIPLNTVIEQANNELEDKLKKTLHLPPSVESIPEEWRHADINEETEEELRSSRNNDNICTQPTSGCLNCSQ
ncbi:hypothetical protein Ddc_18384 [Ditylenchus destructor]|nr:hypothetical protein Ddc_18384 [Ditylenchus destructor]